MDVAMGGEFDDEFGAGTDRSLDQDPRVVRLKNLMRHR